MIAVKEGSFKSIINAFIHYIITSFVKPNKLTDFYLYNISTKTEELTRMTTITLNLSYQRPIKCELANSIAWPAHITAVGAWLIQ